MLTFASLRIPLAATVFSLLCTGASATLIDFDGVVNGTNINSVYSGLGVTFGNPLGISASNADSPNIFARSSSVNNSPGNVVSVFQVGVPAFDSRYGAVEAVFAQAQHFVSIDAAILRLPEALGTPVNRPILEVYSVANVLIATIAFDFSVIPQPGVGGITGFETLSFTSLANDIGKIRFLSGNPGNSPSNFGIFDNLVFTQQDPLRVPEPDVLALLGGGLLVLFLRHRSIPRTHRRAF